MSKIEQKNILEICTSNMDAESKQLEQIINDLKSEKNKLNELEEGHYLQIKEFDNERSKLASTIEECIKHGGGIPEKLEEKKKEIENKIEKTKIEFKDSGEYLSLTKKIKVLGGKKDNVQKEYEIWAEKIKLAEKVIGPIDAFYIDGYEKNLFHLIKINLQKKGLGLSSEKVLVFESINEVINLYFKSALLNLSVSPGGVINEIRLETLHGNYDYPHSKYQKSYLNLIPDELVWIKRFYSKEKIFSNHGTSGNIKIDFTKTDSDYAVNIVSISDGLDEFAAHKRIFCDLRFYSIQDKEFYDINPRLVQIYPIEDIEIETEESIEKQNRSRSTEKFKYTNRISEGSTFKIYNATYDRSRYTQSDRKYGYVKFSNSEKPPISIDVSLLFKDFGALLKSFSIDSLIVKDTVEPVVSELVSDQLYFQLNDNRLSADEIQKEVGIYWKAFIFSSWDKLIPATGALRMVKHLCMRGLEEPDMCSLNYKGHYRFNVRTRDHTWIVGEIFCPPFALGRKTPVQSNEINYEVKSYDNHFVQVGDAVIRIIGEIK